MPICFRAYIFARNHWSGLAVVPRHVSREDFFADFYHHLAKKSEVSKAFVPVIKFKSKDIDMDLTVARLMCNEKIPEDEDFLMHPNC